MHTTLLLPLSQDSKQADTNAIAIIDAKLNLASSIEMDLISVND